MTNLDAIFESLLGEALQRFPKTRRYHVYYFDARLSDEPGLFKDALHRNVLPSFLFDRASHGHFAVVNVNDLPAGLRQDVINHRNIFDESFACLPVEVLLEIAPQIENFQVRTIIRAQGDDNLYDALLTAFCLHDLHYLFDRSSLLRINRQPGALIPSAAKWLDDHVSDVSLKEHFSCFFERERGGRDSRDIFLSWHRDPTWMHYANPFPVSYFKGLSLLPGFQPIMSWAYEIGDRREGHMLIAFD